MASLSTEGTSSCGAEDSPLATPLCLTLVTWSKHMWVFCSEGRKTNSVPFPRRKGGRGREWHFPECQPSRIFSGHFSLCDLPGLPRRGLRMCISDARPTTRQPWVAWEGPASLRPGRCSGGEKEGGRGHENDRGAIL